MCLELLEVVLPFMTKVKVQFPGCLIRDCVGQD
jgi:hypothetical protein